MMPFSVLKPWLLGLLAWAILGTGVYCLWEWADGVDPVEQRRVVDPVAEREVIDNRNAGVGERDTRGGPEYLAWAIGLLALSFGGFIPVMAFMGRPKLDEPKAMRSGEQRMVSAPDGTQIHVEIYGRSDKPTLLLTHGWSLDSTEWYYVKKALSDRYRIVVWDLAGLGKSQRPASRDFSLEKMAADLESVLIATCDSPALLVGHSIGGMIIQTFCRLYPHHLHSRVAAIALVHTTYTNPLATALGAPFWTAIQKPIIEPLNHVTIWISPLAWLSNWLSYLNGSLLITSRLSSFAGNQTWGQVNYASRMFAKASPAVAARGNLAMLRFDAQDILPQIQVPVLIVAGPNDRLTKLEASERIDSLLPHGIITILKPGGHLGHWEQHDGLVKVLNEFASKHQASSAALHVVERAEHMERRSAE